MIFIFLLLAVFFMIIIIKIIYINRVRLNDWERGSHFYTKERNEETSKWLLNKTLSSLVCCHCTQHILYENVFFPPLPFCIKWCLIFCVIIGIKKCFEEHCRSISLHFTYNNKCQYLFWNDINKHNLNNKVQSELVRMEYLSQKTNISSARILTKLNWKTH